MTGARASLEKAPHEVAAMFDGVARRYDRTNDVLSLGRARAWRRAVARAVDARPGQRVLDLAAGTGSSSLAFTRSGADVVACDFSLGMLRVGKAMHPDLDLLAGDALRLPFADGVFDTVTISFGLRNVSDVDRALTEMARVTRPGGRLVVCEFSSPVWRPLRTVYGGYLMAALPGVARRVSSNPDAYVYLAESIRAWPDQARLADRIGAGGWSDVAWTDLTYGIVALHRARRGFGSALAARDSGQPLSSEQESLMGHDDKASNKIEEIGGKAKEGVGAATGDESLERQGERDQSKANLKQAGEKVKDAFKN